MVYVIEFFIEYVILICFLLFVFFIFTIHKFFQIKREKREAVFSLESELANRHSQRAKSALLIIVLLAFAEFIIVVFLAPGLPAQLNGSLTQIMAKYTTDTPTLDAEKTVVYLDMPTGIGSSATGCIEGQVMISSPKPGDQIRGKITLEGSVNIPNFGFYKYEYTPAGSSNWITIQAGREIKLEQRLGDWDTSEIVAGDYLLRLVVSDNQGEVFAECVVPIRIANP